MAAPELLTKVGFAKSKIGSGDKEVGYQIKESSLSSLMGSACICFLVMGFMVVSMVYDVHFEKKTLHRQLRLEEHHAASKLAAVQMELWSEFHSDIQESHEAQALLKNMNDSYGGLQGKMKGLVDELSAEIGMNPIKAQKFADKLLHIVADMHKDNVKHAKHLVSHLVAAGKRSVKLEKHVDHAMMAELKEEKKQMHEDEANGIDVAEHEKQMELARQANNEKETKEESSGASKGEDEEDPLKEMLTGFFTTFNSFETEFKGEARTKLKDGAPAYEKIKELYTKIKGEDQAGMAEDDIQAELDKIDLAGVGASLGSGRVLPVTDIVEELFLIPKIPHKQITALETAWKKGETDSVEVFEQLQELHEKGLVPAGWLQMGVDQEEKEEEQEEDQSEKEEEEKEEKEEKE